MEEKRIKDWIHDIDWLGSIPFILMHLSVLLILWVGFSWPAFIICVVNLFVRLFGITGGYHRYFSHRSFQTSRVFQFLLGFLGASSTQMGPLWWAAHHRHHHRHSDQEPDIHSPIIDTILWSHIGWVMAKKSYEGKHQEKMADFKEYPEIQFLDKHYNIAGIFYLMCVTGLGYFIVNFFPQWQTTVSQVVVWGFFVSTVLLYHVTFSINSFTHLWGTKRYKTDDESRNNFFLALLTMGEGWHNNHHKYPGSSKMGFYWWEIDVTYYVLKILSFFHIIWDLRPPPDSAYEIEKK